MAVPPKPILTPEQFAAQREKLGLSQPQLAAALLLGEDGRRTISLVENGGNQRGVSGPMQIAMFAFRKGIRPPHMPVFPCDEKRKKPRG